ncbi:beta-ketoacyl synthase chain length factor [Sphingobacterium sp. BIGb0165]|uniref:beta-ketoacyl synthase chain length factor n=1 Tax=Sphingobacterium sp. BIGb0165 TaxID=2940615 RepID=UPI00216A83A4|nr:beta-ketoacyl synthase chain length factor [Sphingobacterium sp. BIGb0165]MCS4225576.1 hypothetical protein [Sphingobacterium sp. BIGb0165]
MQKVYINGSSVAVINSAQLDTTEQWIKINLPKIDGAVIPPAATRRMSKAVKMGIICGIEAMRQADCPNPDGILVGTGKGCLVDSDKFLKAIIEQKEDFLSPTAFIQSTHNTVAGQIALLTKNSGYNMTYSQGRISFESAALDAYIQLTMNEHVSLLVGAVDELSDISIEINQAIDKDQINDTNDIQTEGAGFFVFSNQKDSHTLGELKDIDIYRNTADHTSEKQIGEFLKRNQLTINQIDTIIYSSTTVEASFSTGSPILEKINKIKYNSQTGIFDTDIVFAFDLALKRLNDQTFSTSISLNEGKIQYDRNILICNFGEQNSLMLLSRC